MKNKPNFPKEVLVNFQVQTKCTYMAMVNGPQGCIYTTTRKYPYMIAPKLGKLVDMPLGGPTLSYQYNDVLARWNKSSPHKPECECCGRNMTGMRVKGGRYGWYCGQKCYKESEEGGFYEDPNYERKQMGLTGF